MQILKKLILFTLTLFSTIFIIATASAAPSGNQIIAIMYHDITDNPLMQSNYRISTSALDGDIAQFKAGGYTFLRASEATPEYIHAQPTNKFVLLTFDDGYETFYTNIYPILQKYNVAASFYMITSRIDRYYHLTRAQIREMSESGLVEIGSHTHYIHLNDLDFIKAVYQGDRLPDAINDLSESITLLQSVKGSKVTSVAYPNGIYNYEIDNSLRNDLGISVTLSTDFGVNSDNNLGKPLKRINRDSDFSSLGFYNYVTNLEY